MPPKKDQAKKPSSAKAVEDKVCLGSHYWHAKQDADIPSLDIWNEKCMSVNCILDFPVLLALFTASISLVETFLGKASRLRLRLAEKRRDGKEANSAAASSGVIIQDTGPET